MREFDDIHKLIDEQTQNPYEREALRDLASLLAEGALDAEPRESFQTELRKRLLAEANRTRRRVPWFRAPVALGAAAAIVIALATTAALRGAGFNSAAKQHLGAAGSAAAPQQAAAAPSAAGTLAPEASTGSVKSADNMEVASVPQNASSESGQWRAAASDGTAGAAAVSRGLTRPDVRDSSMIKVEPGAATFTLAATMPSVPAQLTHWTMASTEVSPQQVAGEAQLVGVAGDVQTGFDHFWVGTRSPGQPAPAPDVPPYKQDGHWLVAGRDWGSGWSYYLLDASPGPATPLASAADAERAAVNFLQRAGVAQPSNLATAARFESKTGSYWVDWHLTLGGVDLRGVQGSMQLGADGGIRYASWPSFTGLAAGAAAPVLQPEAALSALRSIPFDWYDPAPQLTVTRADIAYRWPTGTPTGAAADLDLIYEFTVQDTAGHEAVLTVPAWQR